MEPLKFVITFENLPSHVSHLSIFMLPDITFDPNYTALIYFQVLNSQEPAPPDFKLLGGLNLNKQSAIFKVNNVEKPTNYNSGGMMVDEDMDLDTSASANTTSVLIGISVEPNEQATALLMQLKKPVQAITNGEAAVKQAYSNDQIVELANKIISNAYNYLSGFVDSSNNVSMNRFNDWWSKFKTKLQNNPKLLDSA